MFAEHPWGMRMGRPPRRMTASSLWRQATISGGKLCNVRRGGPVQGRALPRSPLPLTADWDSEATSRVGGQNVCPCPGVS